MLLLGIIISCKQEAKQENNISKGNLDTKVNLDTVLEKSNMESIKQINYKVNLIESDLSLEKKEFDLVELTGINTDGGGVLKIWYKEKQVYKIAEEIGLSYGRIRVAIYLDNGIPIKVIEIEESFGHEKGELNYREFNEVFRGNVYVFDWENDESKVEKTGKRVLSEGSCSTLDYEPIIERATKVMVQ